MSMILSQERLVAFHFIPTHYYPVIATVSSQILKFIDLIPIETVLEYQLITHKRTNWISFHSAICFFGCPRDRDFSQNNLSMILVPIFKYKSIDIIVFFPLYFQNPLQPLHITFSFDSQKISIFN